MNQYQYLEEKTILNENLPFMQRVVILSVPHGLCSNTIDISEHHCDTAAKRFANIMKPYLEEFGCVVKLFQPDVPRPIVDQNRAQARLSKYRRMLDNEVSNMKSGDVFIDCHSAMKDSLKGKDYNVYILQTKYNIDFTDAMNAYLNKNKVKSWIKHSAAHNDIILNFSIKYGLEKIGLIEINESLNEKEFDKTCKTIAKFISI